MASLNFRAPRAIGVCAMLVGLAATAPMSLARTPTVLTDAQIGFFQGSRADALAHFKRVGLLPAYMPAGFEQREDVRTVLESKISEALRRAGFEVVGSDDYRAALERFNRQLGGRYDTKTGALRSAQDKAVEQNARREFVEKDRLDGYIIPSIRATKADFDYDFAYWDAARERSDGRAAAPSVFERMNNPNNFKGTLPAYSLLLQLVNAEDQVVFGRSGGIQLGSYHVVTPGSQNDFLLVPRDSLFRDEKRLDRAIRSCVVPFMHSAEEIDTGWKKDSSINTALITDLPAPPAGTLPQPEPPLKVPRDQILAATHRVVVSTIGHNAFNFAPEVSRRYMALIRAELEPLGWEVIESDRALAAFGEAVRTSSGIYDPLTGVLDTARVSALRKTVFGRLGVSPMPDAILWVQLVPTVVQHRWGSVTWDGVSQNALTLTPISDSDLRSLRKYTAYNDGAIRAASLLVQLRAADDVLLYENRGGVQLLQQLKGNQAVELAPIELFQDQTREKPAVHAALRDLVLSPEQLANELHPHVTASR